MRKISAVVRLVRDIALASAAILRVVERVIDVVNKATNCGRTCSSITTSASEPVGSAYSFRMQTAGVTVRS
jgi:hypothetical protein